MTDTRKTAFIIAAVALACGVLVAAGIARAQESWWKRPAIMACCSDADAVFADEWRILADGSIIARVTGGGPRNHAWAPVGREYVVPVDKVRDREGNPIGRPLLFLNPHHLDHVYCFVPGVMI